MRPNLLMRQLLSACARAMTDVLQPDDEDIMLMAMEEQEARMEKQEAEQKTGEE